MRRGTVEYADSEQGASDYVRARTRGAPVRVWQAAATSRAARRESTGPGGDGAPDHDARAARRAVQAPHGLAIGSLLAATASALAPPLLAKLAIDDGSATATSTQLGWVVAAFVVAGALIGDRSSTRRPTSPAGRASGSSPTCATTLFRHLQRLSLGFYERNRAGVIISRLTNDVEALDQLVTDGVTSLVQNTLTLVGTAVILFFLDWRLALATLAVLPPMASRPRSSASARPAPTARVRERLGLVTATLAEDIAGHARPPGVHARARATSEHFREVNDALPRREPARPSS